MREKVIIVVLSSRGKLQIFLKDFTSLVLCSPHYIHGYDRRISFEIFNTFLQIS